MQKKTLVLGASIKEERYANKAVKKLRANNIDVVALGLRKGAIGDVVIETEKLRYKDIRLRFMWGLSIKTSILTTY